MNHKGHGEEKLQTLLETKGLKFTFERKTIFQEVNRLSGHFNADGLYERFKNKGMRISRDTVYRTIPLLLESGVIQKSVGSGKQEFFERTSARGHHDHMVCIDCGKIIEFSCRKIETAQNQVCQDHGFKLIFHDHRLFGKCRNCSKENGTKHLL